jgi:hypothetical protein
MDRIAVPGHSIRSLVRAGAGCSLVAAAAACALTFSPACNGVIHPPAVLDCSEEGSYDIIEHYSLTTTPTWYNYGDTTPGAYETGTLVDGAMPIPNWTEPIENGGRCGSQAALVLQSYGYHDYGSGFGDYDPGSLLTNCIFPDGATGNCAYNASAYQGIAFWARAPGEHTKSVTIELADGQSYDSSGANTTCLYQTNSIDGGSNMPGQATTIVVSPTGFTSTGTTTTGGNGQQLPIGTCGNNFVYPLVVAEDWHLYEIPFSAFYQTATPDKEPRGFDPSTFFWIGVIVPKEAQLELWIDELGFYPKKQVGGG